jgi:hypothetical protein
MVVKFRVCNATLKKKKKKKKKTNYLIIIDYYIIFITMNDYETIITLEQIKGSRGCETVIPGVVRRLAQGRLTVLPTAHTVNTFTCYFVDNDNDNNNNNIYI